MKDLNVAVKVKGVLDNTHNMRHVDLTKIIDNNWQNASDKKTAKN